MVWIYLICTCFLFGQAEGAITHHNMSVSDQDQFVWIRVAKNGTRSIYQALRDNGVEFTVDAYRYPFDPKLYKNHFKFAFVRNPWSRVVSCYFDKVVSRNYPAFKRCFGKSFEFFVDFIAKRDVSKCDAHIRLQSALIPLRHVDFIGRVENFEEDMQTILKQIGYQNLEVPHKHTTSHLHYSRYYNKRTKKIIEEKYKKDIKKFGYTFENK